jgi:hypothetical protein
VHVIQFLRDMAARAMQLSRKTLDLSTSRDLRIMSQELKDKSEDLEEAERRRD